MIPILKYRTIRKLLILSAAQSLIHQRIDGGVLVAAYRYHTLVAQEPYGISHLGDLGSPDASLPTALATGSSWRSLATGSDHMLAVDGNGALFSYGDGSLGQLGRPEVDGEKTPSQVGGDHDWKIVAAAQDRSAAIKNDGSMWTWGFDSTGIPNSSQLAVPTKVGTATWKALSLGSYYSLAIQIDGSLWAWGNNNHYSLGDGTNLSRDVPVRIGTDNDWSSVACAGSTSFGIKSDGSLWVWGGASHTSAFGLGPGISSPIQTPIPTNTGNDWRSIHPSATGGFVIGIKQSGTLWSWGKNELGQLGQGDNTTRDVPTQVGSFSDWIAATSGEAHAAAIRSDGSIWQWGAEGMTSIPITYIPTDRSSYYAPTVGLRISGPSGWMNSTDGYFTCPPTIVGEPKNNTVRIHNTGLLPLAISEVIPPQGFDTDASTLDVPPLEVRELNVRLTSTTKGYYSGTLLLRGNHATIPEFPIDVSGQVVSPQDDTDGDGLNDAAEVAMSPLGFNWNYSQSTLVQTFFSQAHVAGLSTKSEVWDVTISPLPPARNSESGGAVELKLLNSSDSTQVPLETLSIDGHPSPGMNVEFDAPAGSKRIRVSGK